MWASKAVILVVFAPALVKSDGCSRCLQGYKYTVENPTNWGGVDKDKACSICAEGLYPCDGIFFTTRCGAQGPHRKCHAWNPGSGDLVPATQAVCPKGHEAGIGRRLTGSSASAAWPLKNRFPTLLFDGMLRGDHQPLDLGRPGRCNANLLVRPLGHILRPPANVSSVGSCCDECSVTKHCEGWVVDDARCTLLTNISSQHEACGGCISGQNLQQGPLAASHTELKAQRPKSKIVV